MSAEPSLMYRWSHALVFSIGENDHAELSQLPNFQNFPHDFPKGLLPGGASAPRLLGHVLAVACLKLYRPWPVEPDSGLAVDFSGGWLVDFEEALNALPNAYRAYVCNSFFVTFSEVVRIALKAPDRLSLLVARIDALDNNGLRVMAVGAIQGIETGPDVFGDFVGFTAPSSSPDTGGALGEQGGA